MKINTRNEFDWSPDNAGIANLKRPIIIRPYMQIDMRNEFDLPIDLFLFFYQLQFTIHVECNMAYTILIRQYTRRERNSTSGE